MDALKCPVCGEINPADAEFCQNCQSRLQPLTGPLRGENNPIQPGQIPTKKVTAELEPILPKWLREAREKARKSSEETTKSEKESPTTPISPKPDLLAGLASQGRDEEEEEVPDWLAGITGGTPSQKKKTEPEDAQVKWVELGGPEDFVQPSSGFLTSEDVNNPAGSTVDKSKSSWTTKSESAPEDELADWLSHLPEQSQSFSRDEKAAPIYFPEFKSEPPPVIPAKDTNWPDNLQTKPLASSKVDSQTPPAAASGETPDWLKNLESQQAEAKQPLPTAPPPVSSDLPDWLQPGSAAPLHETAPESSNVPDWLKRLDQGSTTAEMPPAQPSQEVPDWLKASVPQEENGSPPIKSKSVLTGEPAGEIPPAETPDWLSSLKPVEAQVSDMPTFSSEGATPETPSEETPDWLSSFKTVEEQPPDVKVPSTQVFTAEESPMPGPPAIPAFADESLGGSDVDAIFASMQMPDWLSSVAPADKVEPPAASENPPPAIRSETPITPAELPSWVQAMRPVESAVSTTASSPSGTVLETTGPLEGLHDVLPAVTGFQPTSKPKAHSIKLNATEEQQTQSVLLEQILAAETAPVPMKSGAMLLSQRVLRWGLTVLLFLSLGTSVFAGTQVFPLPTAVPNETVAAMQTLDTVPADAHVLVVFDYEPSTMGEMEATAAPLLDHLLLLKHPQLALISTSPTGSALAELLISTTLADRHYQRGVQYVDLGYLPGGLAGVNDFAQNPVTVIPLGADRLPVWGSTPLQNVTHLTDFAALIVLTDGAESGRVWIEQTNGARGITPLVVVSSAQAGPMLLPYVQSKQVSGLVAGLNGAVSVEQNNAGRPGLVRRYWDAYSIGLLLAVGLMVLGGLWNLVLGLQSRRIAQGQG